ncbi:MAG: Hpt domain-containing protein [Betaproteobacteria bacterium]|jgi:HPt (histidine-containing phosphotransfer) domain-containing protein
MAPIEREEHGGASGQGNRPPLLFGLEEALSMLGGDRELLDEVIVVAKEEMLRQLNALSHSLDTGDAATSRRHAHTLKGTVATLGANGVRDVALEIEHSARDGDLAKSRERLPALSGLVHELLGELRDYQAGRWPPS